MVFFVATSTLKAQQQQRFGLAGRTEDAAGGGSMLIETSPSLANLLSRAEEGIAREDWKFAIDSLQRVIEDPTGTLVPRTDGAIRGGQVYESAGRVALRRMAQLPPAGIRAYRLVHDGRAAGLLERARRTHDRSLLRAVTQRYLLTRHGDEAADLYASWELDAGRPGEAIGVLTDVGDLVTDSDVPAERLFGKLVVANAMLGRQTDALAAAERMPAGTAGWVESLRAALRSAPANGEEPTWLFRRQESGSERIATSSSLSPKLIEPAPWRFELRGSTSETWRGRPEDDLSDPVSLPLARMETDGRRVFIRKRGGAAALDIDDLSLVWDVTTDEVALTSSGARGRQAGREPATGFPQGVNTAATRDEEAVSLIGYAAGLVFVMDFGGRGTYLGGDEVEPETPLFGIVGAASRRLAAGAMRLVAVDAVTGEVRWTRGRTGDPSDVVGDVRFTGAPVAVEGRLWVPYLRGKDLLIGALRPSDGRAINNVLLGSAIELPVVRQHVTPMTLGDGVVYVSSGFGVLFAVDAGDMSLRWAAQYAQRPQTPRSPALGEASPWMPSAPVVANGMVVIAPVDHPDLLAFSAVDGTFRWSGASQQNSYVLGAGDGRIWLAGRGVACRAILAGTPLWNVTLDGVPTGRGDLAGDRLHLPTSLGLVALRALDGAAIATQSISAAQAPLGNLRSLGHALFSVDPTSVRKYPDLSRLRDDASAIRATKEQEVRGAVLLAWAEVLEGAPQKALEILAGLGATSGGPSGRQIARVRFAALIDAACAEQHDHDRAVAFLDQASKWAPSFAERRVAELARAERLQQMGRRVEAFHAALALGFAVEANSMVSVSPFLATLARFDIGERLRHLHQTLVPAEVEQVDRSLADRAERAVAGLSNDPRDEGARDMLRVFADLRLMGATSGRARRALAEHEFRLQRFEHAEQYLLQSSRDSGTTSPGVDAWMRLCEVYEAMGLSSAGLFNTCLSDLRAKFGGQPVPPGDAAAGTVSRGEFGTVGDWATWKRAAVDGRGAADRSQLPGHEDPRVDRVLLGERAWSYGFSTGAAPLRLVNFGEQIERLFPDRVVLIGLDGNVECVDARDGALLWRTELQLPEQFDDHDVWAGPALHHARFAGADGQVAVFSTADGLFAVGLLTGRRLWTRAYETPLPLDLVPHRDRLFAVSDGFVVAAPRDGHLSLMRLLDGATAWERDLRGEPVARLWMFGDTIVTADAAMKRAQILDRRTGDLRARVFFRQPDPKFGPVRLVRVGDVLCGPDSDAQSDGLVGISLADGKRRWRIDVDRPVAQLFEPDDHLLGAGLLGGGVRIVDPASGEVVMERQIASASAVTDGKFVNGTLVVQSERGRGQAQAPTLTGIDVATDEELWRREDLAGVSGESPGAMRIVGSVIPAIVQTDRVAGAAVRRDIMALVTIDVRTGNNVGSPAELPTYNTGTQVNRDLAVAGGHLLVGSGKEVQAFRLGSRTRGDGKF